MKGTVVSLCDYTGLFVEPWVRNGYEAVLVDPRHQEGVNKEGEITKVGHIIDHPVTWKYLSSLDDISFVAAWPPCTDVAVSGAKHFEKKRQKDPHFQTRAALIAEQCKNIGYMADAPWFFENPVSVFSSIFGKPCHYFHPYEFGGYLSKNDTHPE